MIPLGLSSAGMRELLDTLADSHSIYTTVQVLDMAGNRLADVSDRLLAGQVDIDAEADVTRVCSLNLLDVGRSQSFDTTSPDVTALYMDRMLRVVYGVKCPTLGWVGVPVFTGPVTKIGRGEDVVRVEAQGKEALSRGHAFAPMTFVPGARKVDMIRSILRNRGGETEFSFPEYPERTRAYISLARQSIPWDVAHRQACSMHAQLFYDGRGVARMRDGSTNAVFTFREGQGGTITTQPTVDFSTDDFANVVWVKGGIPTGAKDAISVWYMLPASHPLSPERLGRNGVPHYRLEVVEDANVRSASEAEAVARGKLDEQVLQTVEVQFDALPNPLLEPGDVCRLSTREFTTEFHVHRMSLPLMAGDDMSVGYVKRFPFLNGAALRSSRTRN